MNRLALILECSSVLLICAGAACVSHLWKDGPLDVQLAGVALIVPAIASILFLCLSLLVKDLYAVGEIRFPLNLTLPAIYCALLILAAALIVRAGPSTMRMPERMRAVDVWANGSVLLVTFVVASVCLSVLGFMDRGRAER